MSELSKEINRRISRCVKSQTGIDTRDEDLLSSLSLEEKAMIHESGFRCALRVLRRIAKRKFRKWIEEELEQTLDDASKVGERLIRFSSRVGDPVDVFSELILLSSILENLVEDFDAEEILSDHSTTIRLLLMSYLDELKSRVAINSLRPLLFSLALAQAALGKNVDWCASMLALTVEEQLVKEKAVEFGIHFKKKENYHSILEKLVEHLETNKIRKSREMILADGHREIRNKVIHEGWNPTEDETDHILGHVSKAVRFLESEATLNEM